MTLKFRSNSSLSPGTALILAGRVKSLGGRGGAFGGLYETLFFDRSRIASDRPATNGPRRGPFTSGGRFRHGFGLRNAILTPSSMACSFKSY